MKIHPTAYGQAHPQVQPCFAEDAPLLERHPLAFYRTGFLLLRLLALS